MKAIILCLLLLTAKAHAFSDYQALHDCAHLGAGTLVGTTVQVFNQASGLGDKYPWVAFGLTLGVTALAASAKESSDAYWNWEQWSSTLAGGLIATQVHFDFPNRRVR